MQPKVRAKRGRTTPLTERACCRLSVDPSKRPSTATHKGSGQAFVQPDGHRYYLGVFRPRPLCVSKLATWFVLLFCPIFLSDSHDIIVAAVLLDLDVEFEEAAKNLDMGRGVQR